MKKQNEIDNLKLDNELTLRTGLVNKSYFLTPALRSDSPV